MNVPCKNSSHCFDPASPLANISSEQPDKDVTWVFFDGPGTEPPLGSHFDAPGARVICESEISQLDALICATNTLVNTQNDIWPAIPTGPYGNNDVENVLGPTPFPPNRMYPHQPRPQKRQIYFNSAITQKVKCPDGSFSNYFLPAGTFSAFSQSGANSVAKSFAKKQAALHKLCLSDLKKNFVCAEVNTSLTIVAGSAFNTSKNVWSISAGALPAGLSLKGAGALAYIKGTPSPLSVGDNFFTVRVVLKNGDTQEKHYKLTVGEILTDSTLPGVAIGVPYNTTLVAGGFDSPKWSVADGDELPTGLSLDEDTGVISGTPTEQQPSSFTIICSEEDSTNFCQKDFNIPTKSATLHLGLRMNVLFPNAQFITGNVVSLGTPTVNGWTGATLNFTTLPIGFLGTFCAYDHTTRQWYRITTTFYIPATFHWLADIAVVCGQVKNGNPTLFSSIKTGTTPSGTIAYQVQNPGDTFGGIQTADVSIDYDVSSGAWKKTIHCSTDGDIISDTVISVIQVSGVWKLTITSATLGTIWAGDGGSTVNGTYNATAQALWLTGETTQSIDFA